MIAGIVFTTYFLVAVFLQPLIGIYSSISYFRASPKSQSIWLRIAISSYGWLISVVHSVALGFSAVGAKVPGLATTFLFGLGIACISMVFGSLFYLGPKEVGHLKWPLFIGVPCTFLVIVTAGEGPWL